MLLMLPSISQANDSLASCTLAGHPLVSLMDKFFSASETVGHSGHSFWWDYRAGIKVGANEYFPDAPTLFVAVTTPQQTKKFYLNLCNGDIAQIISEISATPTSSAVILKGGTPECKQPLSDMKEMVSALITMDERNAPLAKALSYLEALVQGL